MEEVLFCFVVESSLNKIKMQKVSKNEFKLIIYIFEIKNIYHECRAKIGFGIGEKRR